MTSPLPTESSRLSHFFWSVLLVCNFVAAAFSAVLLAPTFLESRGERWDLVFVLLLALPTMVVEFVVLLVTIILARKSTISRGLRFSALGAIILAAFFNGTALWRVHGHTVAHKQAYIDRNALYLSGLREAVLAGDIAKADAAIARDGMALGETDYEGNSAILLAVRRGDRAMVELLLQRGASANSAHYDQITCLHIAADKNNVEIAKLLLDSGARVNVEDSAGRTALARARAAGAAAVEALLVARGGTKTDEVMRAVKAVESGDIAAVDVMLTGGVHVEAALPNGHCLLDVAAESGNIGMAKFLIGRGASVRRADAYGRTALHWACFESKSKMAEFLLDEGAPIDAQEFEAMTPLHDAIAMSQFHPSESLETVRILVDRGANIHLVNKYGSDVIDWAAEYGTPAIRTLLAGRRGSTAP
jgi:ankyrin repeat protein